MQSSLSPAPLLRHWLSLLREIPDSHLCMSLLFGPNPAFDARTDSMDLAGGIIIRTVKDARMVYVRITMLSTSSLSARSKAKGVWGDGNTKSCTHPPQPPLAKKN